MLVIAQPNGRPVTERFISDKMDQLSKSSGLPKAVFHSLRSTSANLKLVLTGGDIKTVQADTGHSSVSALMDIYARTFPDKRIALARDFDKAFFKDDSLNA